MHEIFPVPPPSSRLILPWIYEIISEKSFISLLIHGRFRRFFFPNRIPSFFVPISADNIYRASIEAAPRWPRSLSGDLRAGGRDGRGSAQCLERRRGRTTQSSALHSGASEIHCLSLGIFHSLRAGRPLWSDFSELLALQSL